MSRSSIFSFSTIRASLWPGRAFWLALALVAAAETALRFFTPNLGWYEGLSSLSQWVSRLDWELETRRPGVWLFGNSVLAYGVDTDALSAATGRTCIALPFGGATLAGETAMMRRFWRTAPAHPTDLVFCITKDDVNPNGERSWISKKYLAYDTLPARLHPDRLFKLFSSRQTIMNTLKSALLGRDTASARSPSEPSFQGVVPPEKYDYMRRLMQDYAIDSAAFDALAAFADRHHCRVHVVMVPVSSAYLDFHDDALPDLPADAATARIADLCATRGFTFLDCSRMAPADLSLYSDPYHLTAAGRDAFTRRLAASLPLAPEPAAAPSATSVADLPSSPLRVACIGDSITAGVGLFRPYPTVLQELSSNRWTVANFGVPGKTLLLQSGRAWADTPAAAQALDFRPDVVVAMFGINDLAHPDLLPAFADDGLTVLTRFRDTNPDVRLYVCTPTPLAPANLEAAANQAIRDTLLPLVDTLALRAHARLIPIHSVYPCTLRRLPDGTHPDPEGARLIAETVFSALSR
jgi:lysophospholipase L1-like esterase